MQYHRVAVLLAGVALAGGLTVAPLAAAEKKAKENIWKDEPKESRHSWWLYRGLSDETAERIMKGLQQRDPAKAAELAEIRKKDPERFKAELREYGRPEINQMIREHYEARRQRRNAEFVEWLKANYPQEEQNLAKLKERNPPLYIKSFDHMMEVYGPIFEAESSNPVLGAVLKEDFDLKKRRDELRKQLRREKSETKRQALGLELQEVVARRYDLIVRRKEIAYEQLLKRLDELQKQVRQSKDEIAKYKDDRVKRENIRRHLQYLTKQTSNFKWD